MSTKRVLVVVSIMLCGAGMAMGQTEWVGHPDNPVIGTEDPGPIMAPGGPWPNAVVFDGTTYHMWFTGTREDGYVDDHGIGHATSLDGVDWTMDQANPVISQGESGEWDDSYVLAGGVIHDGTQFHMWYAGTSDGSEDIGYATSPDGSIWNKYAGNPVMEHGPVGSWNDTWMGPTAVVVDLHGNYKLWFSGHDGSIGQIGYAYSDDGIEWTKRPEPVLEPGGTPDAWNASLLNPSVVFDGTNYHMWYTGDHPQVESKIGYAFSRDGIEWTKHRYNPVLELADDNIVQPCVLLDGSTWQMWYGHNHSLPTADNRVSYATSDCCDVVPAMDKMLFIPAAAVASGAQGAFFQTDVDVSNADDLAIDYQFQWLPRGENNSEPTTSKDFTLGAGKSVRYANVLAEVFDLEPDSLGALLVLSSSPDLLAMSRTYNLGDDGSEGTYGQAIPALATDDFIQQGATRRILFGSENADMRTNIGCQNGADSTTVVYLDLFKGDGSSLGRKTMMLKPFGNEQINRIFDGHNPMDGYVDVTPAQADKPVYCYGSVLDNVTSDPTTIPPQ
jgi:hypothetical protein